MSLRGTKQSHGSKVNLTKFAIASFLAMTRFFNKNSAVAGVGYPTC